VLHAFQRGEEATVWKIGQKLKALCQLFHDTADRQENYTKLTDSMTFPQKFCAHHWVEDLPVEERAREVWPNDVTFVDSYKGSPKSKILTSFGLTKEARNDPMFLTKQHFFISVAKQLQPFLEKFQTDAPVPRSTTTLTGLCDDGPLRQP